MDSMKYYVLVLYSYSQRGINRAAVLLEQWNFATNINNLKYKIYSFDLISLNFSLL
jgi:hypothetical protein